MTRIATFAGVLAVVVVALAGCASPDQVCRVRSLSDVTEASDRSAWSGSFQGIEQALNASKTGNLNILFVHGIGWTQQVGDQQFGFDLAEVLAQRLMALPGWRDTKDLCPRSTLGLGTKTSPSPAAVDIDGGVMLTSIAGRSFKADDPTARFWISDLGCLDRLQLVLPDHRTVSIYRFFWDDALWDSVEWPHLGYDDPVARLNGKKVNNAGYDDVDELRAPANAELKNNLMTWGLVDAAAYIGPAGHYAREGVGAAMCIVAGSQKDFQVPATLEDRDGPDGTVSRRLRTITSTRACNGSAANGDPMVVMSHSLGSRVVFDVLTTDLTEAVSRKLDSAPGDGLTVYMLANQIPLIGVGRMVAAEEAGKTAAKKLFLAHKPRFVAFSEINDLLTYELVPYFEHMAYLRERGRYNERRTTLLRTKEERDALVDALGFDVIDVRVSFAGVIPLFNLARPDHAHSGLLSHSKVVPALLLDGVNKGVPATRGVGKGDCKPHSPAS